MSTAQLLFTPQSSINSKLTMALNLLGLNAKLAVSEDKKESIISGKQRIEAWFNYLHLAGYLSESVINKAVDYLAREQPFKQGDTIIEPSKVKEDLNGAYKLATGSGGFQADVFCNQFAKQTYFSIPDVIDILTFIQQTAFDRNVGQERNTLAKKPWMETHSKSFIDYATQLGVIAPIQPAHKRYCGVAIMGASSGAVAKRIDYFIQLQKEKKIAFDSQWALSGKRELSMGLDEDTVVQEVAKVYNNIENNPDAKYLDGLPHYVEKLVAPGTDSKETRVFADGLSETMMVQYLLRQKCCEAKISIVDSGIEKGHWRATTAESAAEIAPKILQTICDKKLEPAGDSYYHLLIIAEQPYPTRMVKQVQRAFNNEIAKPAWQKIFAEKKLIIKMQVEGCGVKANLGKLPAINSELAALEFECFNDARLQLQMDSPFKSPRNPKAIMFSSREQYYAKKQEEKVQSRISYSSCTI